MQTVGYTVVPEAGFQATVREYAESRGWWVFTTWNSEHSPSGEPDLRLVRPHPNAWSDFQIGWEKPKRPGIGYRGQVIWAELKKGPWLPGAPDTPKYKGQLTDEQIQALTVLADCGEEVYAWWPEDWDQIVEVLA